MAKIAIDARRLRTSTGRYVRELLKQLELLDKDEHEYHVIIHEKDQGTWAPTAPNFTMHVVRWDHYTFGEQLGFASYLQNLSPDLVHFTMPQQPLLYIGKRVTTIHDLTLVRFKNLDKNPVVYWVEQQIFKFLLINVARRSRAVITPSKFVADDVAEYARIPRAKVAVTHEAGFRLPEAEDAESRKRETDSSPPKAEGYRMLDLVKGEFLFYVGNAYPHKNLNRLVDAHQLLLKDYPKLKLVIAGNKDFFHEKLINYAESIGAKNFIHLGYVEDEDLVWLYKHAEAYVFPSLSEGFGLPGLEAMQHEAPLVSSNATCLPEIYGGAAHYFDPSSVEDIKRAIDEVLRSKTRRQKLIRAAEQQLSKYSWEDTARKTLKTYNSLLS